MEIMKDVMLKNGINLEEIKREFFKEPHPRERIKASREYIIAMCNKKRHDIWDVVQAETERLIGMKGLTTDMRDMARNSLLLAWEDIEKNHEQTRLEIYKNSKTE